MQSGDAILRVAVYFILGECMISLDERLPMSIVIAL